MLPSTLPPAHPLCSDQHPPPFLCPPPPCLHLWLKLKLADPVSNVLRSEANDDESGLSIWQSPDPGVDRGGVGGLQIQRGGRLGGEDCLPPPYLILSLMACWAQVPGTVAPALDSDHKHGLNWGGVDSSSVGHWGLGLEMAKALH